MKSNFDDYGGGGYIDDPKVKITVKKGVKLKRVKDEVCGPFGVTHHVSARVCPHDYVHPKDWPFVDVSEIGKHTEYLCPQKCFKVTVTYC
jgi:hypothetical protein